MNTKKPFITQYIELKQELEKQEIAAISKQQQTKLQDLKEKALDTSGLFQNELNLVYTCRKHNLYGKIGVCLNSLLSSLDDNSQ